MTFNSSDEEKKIDQARNSIKIINQIANENKDNELIKIMKNYSAFIDDLENLVQTTAYKQYHNNISERISQYLNIIVNVLRERPLRWDEKQDIKFNINDDNSPFNKILLNIADENKYLADYFSEEINEIKEKLKEPHGLSSYYEFLTKFTKNQDFQELRRKRDHEKIIGDLELFNIKRRVTKQYTPQSHVNETTEIGRAHV